MDPNETHEVTERISRLREELGLAILVIDHDMHVIEGSFDAVVTYPAVVKAYLGSDPEALAEA